MIVTELSKGTKLYLLVGGRGTRLASVTNGKPKPLVDIQEQSFLDIVLDNLSGFDVTLICSDLNYEYFKTYRRSGYEVFNEGIPSGTGGFLRKVNLPDSFYVMNGDTFFSGDLNLDCDESTIFVAEEDVTHDVGYIQGEDGKVKCFVEKNPDASGKELVSLGIYKLFKKDIDIPNKLPVSMEYDILPKMELCYKILKTRRFDIGTPERLQTFKGLGMLKIIGATGNVGKRLLEKSLDVWHDDVEAIATRLDKDELEYDFDSLNHEDMIAFCAAISEPTVCANNPELARKVNVTKTIEFIEKSTQRGARVVFLSSDAVYGNIDNQFDEQWQKDPIGVYGEMKSEVEEYFRGNPNVKVLRSSFNFFKEDRFTSYLEKCALNDEVAEVFSPFERSVIHRDDTVDAILSLSRNWEGPQFINCGGPHTICRSEFAQILKEEVFPSLQIEIVRPPEKFYQDRPGTVSMISNPLVSVLGRPQRTLREAVRMEFDV